MQLAGGKGGGAALERKVAQPEIEQDLEPCDQICTDALGHNGLLGMGPGIRVVSAQDPDQPLQGEAGHLGDVEVGDLHR